MKFDTIIDCMEARVENRGAAASIHNVLHVIASMDPKLGGVCQAVRTIIVGTESNDMITNEVVSLDGPAAGFLGIDSFTIHTVGPAENSWSYNSRLRSWLENNLHRFDTVVIHGLWLYHSWAVYKAIDVVRSNLLSGNSSRDRKMIARVFVFPHGMLDPYFQRDPTRRLKALRNWAYWKLFESRVINNVEGLLFTCEEEKDLARLPFRPYRPKREIVVGLGVEQPPPFAESMRIAFSAKCGTVLGRPYLLFLSRIHPKKGVDILLRGYADLVRSREALNLPALPDLVIAGPLNSDYAKEMQGLARQLSLSSSRQDDPVIHFPGMLTGDQKWGAFYGCEAFILPSHQENFGIAVVEALACGKPVLISRKVNIWREIVSSGAGFAATDDFSGTRDLLAEFAGLNPSGRYQMAINAKACYFGKFGVPAATGRLVNVLIDKEDSND